MGSSPNFRGASALLRGASRAFSPKRGGIRRDAPSVCLTGEGSATPPRRPLPSGPGTAFFLKLKFYSIFFKKLRGRGAELPPPRARGGTLYPVKRFFRVNCREAVRGGFLQEKKPPCINTEQIPATWQNIQAAKRTLILYAGEPPHKAEYQPQLRHSAN